MENLKLRIIYAIKENKLLSNIASPFKAIWKRRLEAQVAKHPLRRYNTQHRVFYGKPLDIVNPKTMYEKICFMEFCTDTSLWTECTDKVAVRDYVRRQGLEKYLNEVYAIFDHMPSVEELDQAMPESCVVKTSNSGGGESVFVVENKDKNSAARIYPKLAKAFADNYALRTGQPHYLGIKPQLIIERLIVNDKAPGNPPDDYKLFCINGKAVFFNAIGDRDLKSHRIKDQFFSLDWQPLGESTNNNPNKIKRPALLSEMISVAEQLAKPFPFVRVDFYESDGKLIFGELTFTPGFDNFIGQYGEKVLKLGEMLDISKVKQIREPDQNWF